MNKKIHIIVVAAQEPSNALFHAMEMSTINGVPFIRALQRPYTATHFVRVLNTSGCCMTNIMLLKKKAL